MRVMMRPPGLALLMGILCCACTPSQAPPTQAPSVQPQRDFGLRVFANGVETDMAAVIEAAAKADYVLVGETHLDDQTHRLEQVILQGVIEQRGAASTVLSMEMFTRDQQAALDGYLSGNLSEAAFLEQAPPWPNYRTGYRPLVETAKAAGAAVVGANLPQSLQRAFAMKKAAAMDELTPEQRDWVPETIHPPADTYWARIEARLRDAGHGNMAGMDAAERTWAIQNLWDNTMADAMVQARAAGDDATVVHVVGAFHAEHGDGIANQLRHRDPQAEIVIVTLEAVSDLRRLVPAEDADRADYVVYALADARGLNDGTLGVTVPGELEYRLSAPAVGEPKGLLVWLGDDETSAEDALTLWRTALGDEVMIAVIEHPHRVLTDDARLSGRWTWPDSFGGDVGRVVAGVDRMVEYLGHRWTVPPKRIVVAGQGSGADVALWAGLYGTSPSRVIALDPVSPRRLAEAGLPDRAPKDRSVLVEGDAATLGAALETLKLAGVPAQIQPSVDLESEVRSALDLPARALAGEAIEVRIAVDSPIARQWAQLHARMAERDGSPRTLVVDPKKPPTLEVKPETFAEGQGLPLAPGPFGGTTILVLPRKLDAKAKAAWRTLGEDDVLKKRSRFATLVVVSDEELGPKLDELHEQGKRSMLILPAAFVVDAARMDAIAALVSGHDADLDVHYLPGLGGSWASSLAD